jgi:hypothetical protein
MFKSRILQVIGPIRRSRVEPQTAANFEGDLVVESLRWQRSLPTKDDPAFLNAKRVKTVDPNVIGTPNL